MARRCLNAAYLAGGSSLLRNPASCDGRVARAPCGFDPQALRLARPSPQLPHGARAAAGRPALGGAPCFLAGAGRPWRACFRAHALVCAHVGTRVGRGASRSKSHARARRAARCTAILAPPAAAAQPATPNPPPAPQAVPNESAREELFDSFMRGFRLRVEDRERRERKEREAAYRWAAGGGGTGRRRRLPGAASMASGAGAGSPETPHFGSWINPPRPH